ncbi:hypothetical protein HZA33_01105 [Candidatus Pacearchaeota archaeon]|nr:hypothetical protein [Candidatus Pacearchaeota archaeon]
MNKIIQNLFLRIAGIAICLIGIFFIQYSFGGLLFSIDPRTLGFSFGTGIILLLIGIIMIGIKEKELRNLKNF